ncbi:MAG: hypothetical protein U0939_13220 [Pirellulales bacterium]
MNASPPIDVAAGHRWFAATFFNGVWDLMDKADRTPDETEQMISMCHASMCHWRHREDRQPINLSVGYWQLSRVYALAERAAEALHYGQLCLAASEGVGEFYLGYAYEALARAAQLAGDADACAAHLEAARNQASLVADADSRQALEGDLESIEDLA